MMVCRSGVPGYGNARLKQSAIIGLILHRNSDWNWLQALEPGGRFELRALFTAM